MSHDVTPMECHGTCKLGGTRRPSWPAPSLLGREGDWALKAHGLPRGSQPVLEAASHSGPLRAGRTGSAVVGLKVKLPRICGLVCLVHLPPDRRRYAPTPGLSALCS